MAKKAAQRIIIWFECPGCGRRNYLTTKNKQNDPQRIERRKYCPWCRQHTIHREVK